jgi:aspartate carbamoyltransferase catalytic subunit
MPGWDIRIGDDPLNLVAAMDCMMVMAAVQSALTATGTPSERALDIAEEAWLVVENSYNEWSTQMENGVALRVARMPVYRSATNGEGKS